jgi:polar amino acid transport system substrate-binding protein
LSAKPRRRGALLVLALLALPRLGAALTIEAVTEDSSYSYLEQGKVGGVAGRIVEALFKQAGLSDYHLSLYPWARAYDRALREPNVAIYPMLRTAERETLFKWVGQLDVATPVFYKLRAAADVTITRLDDAKRYRLGVVRDDYREKYLHDQGFTQLVVSANNLDNFNRLLNRQVQAVPMPERDARKLCADAQIPYETLERLSTMEGLVAEIWIAFSQGTADDLVARVRTAFVELQRTGEIQRLLNERR